MSNNDAMEILAQLLGLQHISDLNDLSPEPTPVKPPEPVKTTVAGKYCNKCEEDLDSFPVITELVMGLNMSAPKNLYYCKNNKCKRFGLLTVVAKTTKLV